MHKALKWGQETCIWSLYKLDFGGEGHVQSGHVGLPLMLNKALEWGQEAWMRGCTSWTLWKKGMLGVIEWAFPCFSTVH